MFRVLINLVEDSFFFFFLIIPIKEQAIMQVTRFSVLMDEQINLK